MKVAITPINDNKIVKLSLLFIFSPKLHVPKTCAITQMTKRVTNIMTTIFPIEYLSMLLLTLLYELVVILLVIVLYFFKID